MGTSGHRTAWFRRTIALIALGAVLIGCAGCSGSTKSASGSVVDAGSGSNATASAPDAVAVPLAGKADTGSSGSSADSASGQLDLDPTTQIKVASLTVAAKNVGTAATSAIEIATAAGGGVADDIRTAPTPADPDSGSAQLTLKVAPDQLEPALTQLDALGTERSRQTSTQDVSGQVADVNSRVASAQASIAQLQALFSRATAVGDVVAIEGQLATREADLESLQAQQRALSAQTSLATITLNLVPLGAPVVAAKTHRSGFLGGLDAGGRAFVTTTSWVLTAVGAVLPFALLIVLIGAGVLVGRRRLSRGATPRSDPGVVE